MSSPETYLAAFLCGGLLCLVGQILIDKTRLTPARILVLYVVVGVVFGRDRPVSAPGGPLRGGATVPLTGFGYNLAVGVAKAVETEGALGIFTGGGAAAAGGLPAPCSSAIWWPSSSGPSRRPNPVAFSPPACYNEKKTDRGGIPMVSWEELENACQHCRACPLAETRTNVVFGVGDRQADILFIGGRPRGSRRTFRGNPLWAQQGKLLDLMLSLIDLERSNVYIANIVKCRPQKPGPSQHRAGRLHWVSAGPNRSAPA